MKSILEKRSNSSEFWVKSKKDHRPVQWPLTWWCTSEGRVCCNWEHAEWCHTCRMEVLPVQKDRQWTKPRPRTDKRHWESNLRLKQREPGSSRQVCLPWQHASKEPNFDLSSSQFCKQPRSFTLFRLLCSSSDDFFRRWEWARRQLRLLRRPVSWWWPLCVWDSSFFEESLANKIKF